MLTFQDFLKATADIYHPKRKKRLDSDEKRLIIEPYINFYIAQNRGEAGDHMHNVASQSWHAYKTEINKKLQKYLKR